MNSSIKSKGSQHLEKQRRDDIPQELLDNIIDQLHDDVTSLAACSLVSHAWLNGSRCHLFYSLRHVFDTGSEDYDVKRFLDFQLGW